MANAFNAGIHRRNRKKLIQHVERLKQERERLEFDLTFSARNGSKSKLLSILDQLREVNIRLDALRPHIQAESEQPSTFIFSSEMLAQSFTYCTADESEGAHFIVGVELDGARTGTRFVPFQYEYRSPTGASGNHMATHAIGIQLYEWDHKYLALIHSHPRGCANTPSSVDRRTQELWEKTTKIIGGIWDREGRIRFYSNSLRFRVQIIGNFMEQVDENLYQLKIDEARQSLLRQGA